MKTISYNKNGYKSVTQMRSDGLYQTTRQLEISEESKIDIKSVFARNDLSLMQKVELINSMQKQPF